MPIDFDWVYKEHYDKIWAFIYDKTHNKDVAKDIAQDTFLKAMTKIDQYDQSKPILSWLFGIAHKQIIDRSRLYDYSKVDYVPDSSLFSDDTFNPENVYALKIKREINRNLRDQISKLSPGQQSALMRTLKGMKAKDIAAQDGCCIGKVLKDIHRAKEMLRRKKNLIFEKEGFNETCSIIFRGVFADGILFC